MSPDIWFYNLGIKIEHVRNVAFSIGGFDVYFYGIFMALAIMAGYAFAVHDAKMRGYDPNLVHDFVLPGVVVSLYFARLQVYGSIVGGIICIFVYTKIKKVGFLEFTDICIRGLLTGQIIGRWGNFFNREAFGRATDGLFAMRMKLDQVKIVGNVIKEQGMYIYNGAKYPIIDWEGTSYIQVHPTFLYEALWNLGLLLLLTILYKKSKDFKGRFTAIYFIGYGIGRFWIENLRTDQLKFMGLPISMLLSLFFVIVGIVIICINHNKN